MATEKHARRRQCFGVSLHRKRLQLIIFESTLFRFCQIKLFAKQWSYGSPRENEFSDCAACMQTSAPSDRRIFDSLSEKIQRVACYTRNFKSLATTVCAVEIAG